MKLRPVCLANISTTAGSWICADCRQTSKPTTYVYRGERFCPRCVENRLKVEFMDLLLDASPELTLDGLMVHVAALVVDERLRLQDDAECPVLTGADRAELREAENEALDDDGPDEKGAARIKALDKATTDVLFGCAAIEGWIGDKHLPAPLAPMVKAVVARAVMLSKILTVYTDKPLYRHLIGPKPA